MFIANGNPAKRAAESETIIASFNDSLMRLQTDCIDGVTVDSVRADRVKDYQTDNGWAVVATLDDIAKTHNRPVSAIALAWLRSYSQVSTPIASARAVEQLIEIIEVVQLSNEEVSRLSSVSR